MSTTSPVTFLAGAVASWLMVDAGLAVVAGLAAVSACADAAATTSAPNTRERTICERIDFIAFLLGTWVKHACDLMGTRATPPRAASPSTTRRPQDTRPALVRTRSPRPPPWGR